MKVNLTYNQMNTIVKALENESTNEQNEGMGRGWYSYSRCATIIRKKFEKSGWTDEWTLINKMGLKSYDELLKETNNNQAKAIALYTNQITEARAKLQKQSHN